jgi:hypothetical protein
MRLICSPVSRMCESAASESEPWQALGVGPSAKEEMTRRLTDYSACAG